MKNCQHSAAGYRTRNWAGDPRLLAAIIKGSEDAIISSTPAGVILTWNHGAEVTFGYKAEDAIGRNVSMLMAPERLPDLAYFVSRVSQGDTVSQYESLCQRKDGRTVYVSVTGSPLRNSAGEVEALSAILRDISQQKQAEAALMESEERFRIMADGCPAVMWVTDAGGGVRFINRAYRELIGTTYEATEGNKWQLALHPEDSTAYLEAFQRAVREQAPFRAEARARCADGEWRWMASFAEPRFSMDGKFLGQVGLSLDISERRQAEQAVRDSLQFTQATINALSSHVCVLNEAGTIVAVNKAWQDFAAANVKTGSDEEPAERQCLGTGANYLAECDRVTGSEAREVAEVAAGIRAVLRGEREQYSMEYACHGPNEQRWFMGRVTRFSINHSTLAMVEHINITDRKLAENALLESREVLKAVLNTIPVRVFWKDRNLMYVGCNVQFARDAGFETPEGLIGRDDYAAGWHAEAEQYRADDRAVIESGVPRLLMEETQTAPSGERIHLLTSKLPLRDSDGAIVGVLGSYYDITERKRAEDSLRESEERHRKILQTAMDGFSIVDMQGRVLEVNDAYCRMTGYSAEELRALSLGDLVAEETTGDISAQMDGIKALGQARFESRKRRKDGSLFDVEVSARYMDQDGGRYVAFLRDITDRKQAELSLLYQARHDELTGLPNRLNFRETLAVATAALEPDKLGAVFFIDLDYFKLVNDTLGHWAGDLLLMETAGRLRGLSPDPDNLGRFGGDEFTLLATGFETIESVREFGERIASVIEGCIEIEGRKVFLGASVGISVFPEDGVDPQELMRKADMAMHAAKKAGKNQVKVYDASFAAETDERLDMHTHLRTALSKEEFRLHFQPIFPLGSSRPSRYEALIRWAPSGLPVSPAEFIPLAEEAGLIIPIGTWVLGEACRRCVQWQKDGLSGVSVSVNISALQFHCRDFVDTVASAIANARLPADLLMLEITESFLMEDLESSIKKLMELRKLGVHIALDDFGTGYSSLSYLQMLPLDILKIDRGFLMRASQEDRGITVMKCVIDLAHALQLRVIAEGVETPMELNLLTRLGCDEFQGYLLGRPSFAVTPPERRSLFIVDRPWSTQAGRKSNALFGHTNMGLDQQNFILPSS